MKIEYLVIILCFGLMINPIYMTKMRSTQEVAKEVKRVVNKDDVNWATTNSVVNVNDPAQTNQNNAPAPQNEIPKPPAPAPQNNNNTPAPAPTPAGPSDPQNKLPPTPPTPSPSPMFVTPMTSSISKVALIAPPKQCATALLPPTQTIISTPLVTPAPRILTTQTTLVSTTPVARVLAPSTTLISPSPTVIQRNLRVSSTPVTQTVVKANPNNILAKPTVEVSQTYPLPQVANRIAVSPLLS